MCCAHSTDAIHRDIVTVARGAAARALKLDADDPHGVVSMAIYGELVAGGTVPPAIMEDLTKHTREFIDEIRGEQPSK